jgi:beta-lactamase regulating signal transducer with metallopeptidase domain
MGNETLPTEMIASLAFSLVAAGLVLLAGRKDAARDPRLTLFLLVLMALVPVMATFVPKVAVLPTVPTDGFAWGKWLSGIWAVGFVFFLTRLALAAHGLSMWRKRSAKVDEIRGVEIREVSGLHGPVAAGVLRKVIFVPETWRAWNEADREIVLRHELSHHRRADPLWRLCAEIARAAMWWHPLAHWMAGRFNLQCEYACDEAVVQEGTDAKTYARLLCSIAEKQSHAPLALAMANPSSLHRHVARMLQPSPRFGMIAFVALATLGAAAAAALSALGGKIAPVSDHEIHLRLTADPFPGRK